MDNLGEKMGKDEIESLIDEIDIGAVQIFCYMKLYLQ